MEPLEHRLLMSTTISDVSWFTPIGSGIHRGIELHNITYELDPQGSVYSSTGVGNSTRLGIGLTQISAGYDTKGLPEVYGIASSQLYSPFTTGNVWVNDDGAGWKNLGGDATQISASIDGIVYATNPARTVFVDNNGAGWKSLGGQATQISSGIDGAGNSEVYATGYPSPAGFVNDGKGWQPLGGQLKQISGTIDNTVYGIGENNAVYVDKKTATSPTGWTSLGGQAIQISAGVDAGQNPQVYAIGSPSKGAFVNDGAGWQPLGGSCLNISASRFGIGPVSAVGQNDQGYVYTSSGFKQLPAIPVDAIQEKYASLGGASSFLGKSTSGEMSTPTGGGLYETFQGGAIYSSSTGVYVLNAATQAEVAATVGETDFYGSNVQTLLGLPTSDSTPVPGVPNATFTNFQGGTIYYSPSTGAHLVYGSINAQYNAIGGPASSLGLPTSEEGPTTTGRQSYFQNGKILWSPGGGTTVVNNVSSITYNWPNLTFSGSTPVGGYASLTVNSDGSYDFSGHLHDSGFPSYNVSFGVGLLSPTGVLYTFVTQGHTNGTLESGSRDYNWNVSATDPALASGWADLLGGTSNSTLQASWDGNSTINSIEQGLGTVLSVVALFLGGSSSSTNQAPPAGGSQ